MLLQEVGVDKKFRFAGRVYRRLNDINASCINDSGFTLMLNLGDEVEPLDGAKKEPTNINPIQDPVAFYEEECCGHPEECLDEKLGPTGDVVDGVIVRLEEVDLEEEENVDESV